MGIDDVLSEHRGEPPAQGSGLNERGGCAVDWAWLREKRIARVTNGLDDLVVEFADGTTFTVRALLWEGKPFLSFAPLRPE